MKMDDLLQVQTGLWICLILLSCILNGFVIISTTRLYKKKPSVKLGLPKLYVISVCCAMQLLDAAGPSLVGIHINRLSAADMEPFICKGLIAFEWARFVFDAMVVLLVGAVVFVEGLRLQRFVSLTPQVYTAVAVVLVTLSISCGFVVGDVFFFWFVRYATNPCAGPHIFAYLDMADKESIKLMAIVDFIVPHSLVFMACLLLLIAYFTRSSGSRSGIYAQISLPLVLPAVSGSIRSTDIPALAPNAVISGPTTGIDSTTLAMNSDKPQENDLPDQTNHSQARRSQQTRNSSSEEDDRFQWYVVLAAVVSFVFHFLIFLQLYSDMYSSGREGLKRVAAVLLLSLKGVFLPCCWLLDRDVRSVWTCGSRQTSARSCRSPQKVGLENVVMEHV